MAYTTINKSTDYFNTKLYTGTGATQSITGVGHEPSLTYIKCRTDSYNPTFFDAVRGATKRMFTHSNAEESTVANSLTSFNSDGFTLGADGGVNYAPESFVSWNWKANGAGSANTDGSINSTVSVNQTAGCSIVSYTSTGSNATVGHGLGVVPSTIIIKRRSGDVEAWVVYHKTLGGTKYVLLNSTDAVSTSSTRFNNTAPTSSVFSLGTSGDTNGGSSPFIAYCFAEKTGYSKFGTYTGNGNADGTFVYTGFKPSFVLAKKTNEANTSWIMLDNKRLTSFNPIEARLFANLSAVEDDINTDYCDLVSNGFKIRKDDNNINDVNDTYIYMAFGQSLVGTNGVTAKAR